VLALEYAIQILQGKREPGNIVFPPNIVTPDNVKIGENAFPDIPDGVFDDFASPFVPMCPDGALHGKPCPGSLTVKLPE
jgi:hypothetical protein